MDKPKKIKREFIPWTTEETNLLLTSVKGSRLFLLYMVAWGVGLRRSEILGLQWPDINFTKSTLTVNRALVKVKSEDGEPTYKIQEPKTKKSRRLLELGEDLKVISDRLGHSTITLTADTYSHVRERLQWEASNKLDQVLNLMK